MTDNKIINPRRPIPTRGYDRLRENLSSGFANEFPVQEFPLPDNRPNINKGTITTRKDDTVGEVHIGLEDHDKAIAYYFNNVIKPHVLVNGNRTKVPVLYGSAERWKTVQQDGYYRDKEGKIQTPLIYFKRDSVEKRRDLGNKIDGNNPQLYYTFQEKYTKRNQYDNFSVLQNREPQKEFHRIVIPDFIKLTYTATIWCDFISQMNGLIESINYSSDSYWGDPERFKFMARIDTFANNVEVAQGSNRNVKTNFGLDLQGYIVPDAMSTQLASQPKKYFSKSTVSFNTSVVSTFDKPKTRDEIRETTGAQNIQQIGTGIGYQIIGENNQIG